MRKIIFSVTAGIFLLLFLSVGYYLTKTDDGTLAVFNYIEKKYPQQLDYDNVKGHLLGTLEFTNLVLHLDQGSVRIPHIKMHSRLSLLHFGIKNDYVITDQVTITPHTLLTKQKPKDKQTGFPLRIFANNIQLNHVTIKLRKKEELHLPSIKMMLLLGPRGISCNLLDLKSTARYVEYINKKNNHHLALDIPLKKARITAFYDQDHDDFKLSGEVIDVDQGFINLNGTGTINGHNLKITANHFHLNDVFLNYWPSVFSFNLNLHQDLNSSEINLDKFVGQINGQPVAALAHVVIANKRIQDLQVNLTSNASKIILSGNKLDTWDLHWVLETPNLNLFLPNSKGNIMAKGQIVGPISDPEIAGNVTLSSFKLLDYAVQNCTADFKIERENKKYTSTVHLAANNIEIEKFFIRTLQLNGYGTPKKHDLDLQAKLPDVNAKIKLAGGYENNKWTGQLVQATLVNNKQQWQSNKPTALTLSHREFNIAPLCLATSSSSICFSGSYQKNQLMATINADKFDLSLVNFLLPEQQSLTGKINLSADLNFTPTKNILRAKGSLMPSAFHYMSDDHLKTITVQEGRFDTTLDSKANLNTNIDLTLPEGQANSKFSIANFKFDHNLKQKKLTGDIKAQVSQLHYLEVLIPAIRNMSGKVLANFKMSGTIADPNVTGDIDLAKGEFKIPKLNLQVTNVNISAKSIGNDITIKGNLMSGNGNLNFAGKGKIDGTNIPIELQLQGNNVLICNQPEIKILATPNIKLNLTNKDLKLAGTITIPEAKLHPHDFGSTVGASDDIVFIQTNGKQVENSNVRVTSDINLILGNNIYLTYKGINGQILGQVRIEDAPNKATVAYGQLRLQDGIYNIYGKNLKIEYGKLNFTGGPTNNPGLEIRASRTLQSVNNHSLLASQEQMRVGVNVLGTAKEPKITLFSEPSGKPPSDILSYLLLGIPADSVSGTNSELLLQAASTIGGGQGGKLLGFKEKLKNSLGLSELDIGTQSEIDPKTQESFQHTAFVLGKYLSPKFYINYSLDLFDHTNTFKVRYLLNRFWTIQSVANTNNSGIDILYTVEK